MKIIRIGLFGFGTVGQGLYELITKTSATFGEATAEITRICIRDAGKNRPAPAGLFTANPRDILDNPEIDIIVEAISETEPAFAIVKEALQRWIPVVSASKKMLALHLQELVSLQAETRTPFRFEAAVGGAIPIISSLRESLSHEPVRSIRGILNGTSNYILTQMRRQNWSYQHALAEAQRLGFAEADPSSDVEAWDPTYKLCLLSWQAFGHIIHPSQVVRRGINQLPANLTAPEANNRLRLVAQLEKNSDGGFNARIEPEWVSAEDPLYGIEYELNAVQVNLAYSGPHTLSGRGAGGLATGSAVLADIRSIIFQHKYLTDPIFSG
jgi:homoserine dehydrogenase